MKEADKYPQIAVIGDAGQFATAEKIALARETGALLAQSGFRLVTGGMGGVMEAACAGALSVTARPAAATIGVMPQHDKSGANDSVEVAIPTNMGKGRNQLVALSDAVIVIGGGAGTLNEAAFAWMYDRLVIALRCEGWSGEIAGRRMDGRIRFADIPDDKVYAAATPREALDILIKNLPLYRRYAEPAAGKLNRTFAAIQKTAQRARVKTQGGLACFIRHSIRYSKGQKNKDMPLTESGKQAAWILGRCLPDNAAAAILHTRVHRARQTAEQIAAGCGFAGEVREESVLADFCYADKKAAGKIRQQRGVHFVEALCDPSCIAEPPFACPDAGVAVLAATMLKAAKGALCIGVSHDWLLHIAAMRALGHAFEGGYQADFLDALFLWSENGRLHFAYKDEDGPCCPKLQAAFWREQKQMR